MRGQKNTEQAFWANVKEPNEHGCRNWKTGPGKNGYGKWTWEGYSESAHVMAFFFSRGQWPQTGLVVCHTCHNKICCEPSHLREDTQANNLKMMLEAGRHRVVKGAEHPWALHPEWIPKGEECHNAKLTEEDVIEIYDLTHEGFYSQSQIAAMYEINQAVVSRIKHKKVWKHLWEDD